MTRRVSLLALAAAGLLVPRLAAAQASADLPTKVQWSDVLRLAREVSPKLELERQGVAMAEADRTTARAWPNPKLDYEYDQPKGRQATLFDGAQQQDVGVELPIPKPGLRTARMGAAEHSLEAARSQVNASSNELAAEAGRDFIALLESQEQAAALARGQRELEHLREVVAARQGGGLASQYDLLRVDVEVAGWSGRTADAEAEVRDRQADLALLLGLQDWQPEAVGKLDSLVTELQPSGAGDVATHPALVAASQEEEAAKQRVSAAKSDRFPDLSVLLGRTWTNAPQGASQNSGVSIEVPIGDTRSGPLQRAIAEASAAGLKRRLLEAQLRVELERHAALAEKRRAVLEDFERRVGQRLPQLAGMAEDAYRLGKSSIIELLDATRTRYDVELERQSLQAQLAEAEVQLAAARGALTLPAK